LRIAIIGGRGIPKIYSGVEMFICDFAPRLVARGHEVWVYGLREFVVGDTFRGVRVIARPHIPLRQLTILSHSFFATLHALLHGVDLIHFQNIGPSCFAVLTRLLGVRSITTFHSLNWQHSKWSFIERWLIHRLASAAIRAPNAAVAVARQHCVYLQRHYRSDVLHIPNAIDCDITGHPPLTGDRAPRERPFVLYTGRISPEKRLDTLIEAFHSWDADLDLVVCGDDNTPYAQRLKQISDPRIVFLGHVEPEVLGALYSHALMFVLPSESEGFSVSLLEAMRSGVPLIVSAIPENLDVVEDCALTFGVGDAKGLQLAMEALYSDPAKREAQAAKAKCLVSDKYSWRNVLDQYERIYKTES
jgi:glycosyltransferase involved in cell wall biosynthesis